MVTVFFTNIAFISKILLLARKLIKPETRERLGSAEKSIRFISATFQLLASFEGNVMELYFAALPALIAAVGLKQIYMSIEKVGEVCFSTLLKIIFSLIEYLLLEEFLKMLLSQCLSRR